MNDIQTRDPWGEINGGLRGSNLLRAGALLSIPAALLNFATVFLPSQGISLGDAGVTGAWLLWIASLFLLAAGFMWVGIQPFFTRYGWAIGAFYLLNALYLVLVLFAQQRLPVPGVSIALGRTVLLLFFAMIEKKGLPSRHAVALVLVSVLQFAKIAARLADLWPELDPALDAGLDALVLVATGVVLLLVAGDIRHAESAWARELAGQRANSFAEFNNPEHQWNREK